MTEFIKYPHVERWGTTEVEGIEIGSGLVFPKLDGTNASVWREHRLGVGDVITAGSRTRELTAEADNFGFFAWVQENRYRFAEVPAHWRLFGEWLVPHTFKHYREEAWRRFWVFDVFDTAAGLWLPYSDYAASLWNVGVDTVDPLIEVTNPTEEQLRKFVEMNTFLVQDGAGPGEGIVLKNYNFINRYGRNAHAKIVRNEFKEENRRAFGTAEAGEVFQVEVAIAQEYVTPALVSKERDKIEQAWNSGQLPRMWQIQPRLLETIYHCIVTEELWAALKKHKNPTIDFNALRRRVYAHTKLFAKDLF